MLHPSTITTIIFDMFQTLVRNDEGEWKKTFASLCQEQRLPVETQTLWQTWRTFEGVFRRDRVNLEDPERSPPFRTYYEAWRDAFRDAFRDLGLSGQPEAAARHCVLAMVERPAFLDALSTVESLRLRGFRLAILSNSDDDALYPLVRRLGLPLEAVLSSETARAYKPHPGPFRRILQMLDAHPHQALYVGDSLLDDVHGAKGVGMHAAWINRNGARRDQRLTSPDVEITSLTQLEGVLAQGA